MRRDPVVRYAKRKNVTEEVADQGRWRHLDLDGLQSDSQLAVSYRRLANSATSFMRDASTKLATRVCSSPRTA